MVLDIVPLNNAQ